MRILMLMWRHELHLGLMRLFSNIVISIGSSFYREFEKCVIFAHLIRIVFRAPLDMDILTALTRFQNPLNSLLKRSVFRCAKAE